MDLRLTQLLNQPRAISFAPSGLEFGLLAAFVFGQDDSSQSLGDVARKLRKDVSDEVRMTDSDAKKLFDSVDQIFAFASDDSGLPKHSPVKRRMVGKADVEKYASGRMAREEYTKHFQVAELTMKKLGFLPREFNLREFLVKSTGQQIAGRQHGQEGR